MSTTSTFPDARPALSSVTAWTQRARQFLRWWRQELGDALPPTIRQKLFAEEAPPLLVVAGDQSRLLVQGNAGALVVVPKPAETPVSDLLPWVTQELARLGKPSRIAVAIGPEDFVQRVVTLPAAAEENLDAVLGFELDRHTPFKVGQARYRGRVVSRSAEGGTLRVRLIASPVAHVDALLTQVRGGAIDVVGVYPLPDAIGDDWRDFNLMGAEAASGLTSVQMGWLVATGLLFLALLAAALLIPVWQKREAAIALLPQLNAAKEEAANVQRIRADVERIVNDTNFIRSRKHASVPPVTLIEDLAKSFPDTSWLMVLEVKQGPKQREVVLTGEAAAAAKVVETLEQLPYLSNASFRSPLTKLQGQAAERFVIAAELKSRPVPAAALEQLLSPPVDAAATTMPSANNPTTPQASGMAPQPAISGQAPANPPAKDAQPNPAPALPEKAKGGGKS